MYEKVDEIGVYIYFIENEIIEIELITKIRTTETTECLDFYTFFTEKIYYDKVPFFPENLDCYYDNT